MRERHAIAFVGDHLADVAVAKAAGIIAMIAATGTVSGASRHAGANVVLNDLVAFPSWLDEVAFDRG